MGWIFINKLETHALLTSINKNTKYKDWNPNYIGTVAVTPMSGIRLTYMGKITIKGNNSNFSEVAKCFDISTPIDNFNKFCFTTYRITRITSIFVFDQVENKLYRLSETNYRMSEINPFVVEMDLSLFGQALNGVVSISYMHELSYNIIDIPHDMRITKEYDNLNKRSIVEMPVNAVARKSQYELGSATNYSYNNISIL